MAKLTEWLAIVGKTYEDEQVQGLRAAHGLKGKGPRVDNFGSEVVPSAGLALMLSKAVVAGKATKVIYGITFYSRPKDDRVPYTGELPNKLAWNEGQSAVRARLGQPQSRAQLANSDVYDFGDYALSVEYADDAGTEIKVVQIRLSRDGGNVLAAGA